MKIQTLLVLGLTAFASAQAAAPRVLAELHTDDARAENPGSEIRALLLEDRRLILRTPTQLVATRDLSPELHEELVKLAQDLAAVPVQRTDRDFVCKRLVLEVRDALWVASDINLVTRNVGELREVYRNPGCYYPDELSPREAPDRALAEKLSFGLKLLAREALFTATY